MLRVLRESAGSWIIKVLMGIMVAAFVLVGTGSYKAYRTSKIATVNGEKISIGEYQTAYYNILENIRRQFGNQLNDEMMKMLNIQQQALDQVIEITLLRQTAEANKIEVSDKELADAIVKIPVFQDNGKFDAKRYKLLLNQNRMTPESFEAMQKEAMLMDKLRSIVTSCAKVSDDEGKKWYLWENASATIDYVVFSPDADANVEISDAMLEEYYNAHKEEYKTEPVRKVRYLKFDPASYKDRVSVTDDEIQQYYTDHEEEFIVDETASGRQIVLKVAEKAPADEVEKRRQEALAIFDKAKSGEDFAELAKKYSEGPDKENGGAFGPFSRKGTLPAIADAAFSLEIGGISEPIRTRFGWHIIKIETRTPETTSPLEKVSDSIRAKLTAQQEKNLAYDDATSLYDNSLNSDDLLKNAAELNFELKTSDFFSRSQGPVDVDAPEDFAKIAFELPLMEISDVAEFGESYYLIQAIEEKPVQIPALEDIKDKVRVDVTREQQEKNAETGAKQFLEKAKAKGDIRAAAQEAGMEVKTAALANRKSPPPPEIDKETAIAEAAFNLSDKNKMPENPIKGQKGYYIIELTKREEPVAQGYASVRSPIINRLTTQKQSELFKSWVEDLRKKSTIEISDKMLKQTGI
jgi:peptidyl-prolyl cis-trans isomerase D